MSHKVLVLHQSSEPHAGFVGPTHQHWFHACQATLHGLRGFSLVHSRHHAQAVQGHLVDVAVVHKEHLARRTQGRG